jgi:hypothetical protein
MTLCMISLPNTSTAEKVMPVQPCRSLSRTLMMHRNQPVLPYHSL